MKNKSPQSPADILRQKAEAVLYKTISVSHLNLSEVEALKLIHELDVHQIELEMLNEELSLAKKQAEMDAEKYINLYDFAPSGYFTLSNDGEIIEINFSGAAILGKERSYLLKKRFGIFVSDETRPIFNLFFEELIDSKAKQTCEVILSGVSNSPVCVHLSGIASDEGKQCMVTMLDISQRKKAEEKTKISEEKYHTLFDANKDSITIFRLGADGKPGKFLETNPATTALFGFTKKELLSMTIRDLESVSDKKIKSRLETLRSQGKIDIETNIKTKKGNLRNVEVEIILIDYLNQPAVMNITRDITERKQLENNIKKVNESLATVLESIPDLLFEVGQDGRIYHYQSHRDDLLALPPDEFMGKLVQEVLPAEASKVCFEALQESKEKGWSTGKEYSLDLSHGKFWFELSVSPIKNDDAKDLHYILLARDISQRKESEVLLRESEENLSAIFSAANSGIVETDSKGKFILFNDAWPKMIGYTKEELTGMSITDIIHPDSLEKSKENLVKINNEGYESNLYERHLLKKDGSPFWGEASLSRKSNSDGTFSLVAVITDITKRKEAEQALLLSQEKLQGFSDATFEAIFISEKGICVEQNSAAKEMFGYTNEEAIGQPAIEWIIPEDREFVQKNMLSGYDKPYEVSALRKDGTTFPCLLLGKTMDYKGKAVRTTSLTDISEQKRIEEKLQKSKSRLIEAQALAKIGNWETDLSFSTVYWSKENYTIFGIQPKENELNLNTFLSLVHPEDRTQVETRFVHSIKTNTLNSAQHRIITPDGQIKYVEERWKIIRDDQGQALRAEGTCQDITERKLAELIQEKTLQLFHDITCRVPGVVYQFRLRPDGSSCFPYASDGIKQIYDVYPDEVKEDATKVFSVLHPDDLVAVSESIQESAQKLTPWSKEYRVQHKDGTILFVLGKAIPQKEEDGSVLWHGYITDITLQKNIEEKLRESEGKYRGLVEGSPDGVAIYSDDKIIYINDEGLRMMGAKNRSDFIGKPVLQFIHPDSQLSVIQRMKEVVMDNNASATVEEKFIGIYGNTIDVEIKAIPTIFEHKAAVQIIVHDITERKRTQEKIHQLSQAVEQSPVTIIITNTKGEIEYANPKFEETTGYRLDEVVGQNPRFLKSGYTSPEEYKKLWQALVAGKEWRGEFHNRKKNGELYWESASISPIVDTQGKITHYIDIKENITDRKNIELDLIRAKNQAEESDRLKLAFLANMSHEIRTPMNGILGFTELLKEPKLTGDEQQEYIKIIEKSGRRMLNIINDIISISKVESGQMEVSLSETNVNEQIDYLTTFFKPETKQKGIELVATKNLSPKESFVLTDREKIYAVLTNLIKNAIKFTDSGSIEFGCERKGKNLEFFVKDSGLGIPKSQQKIIFERFRQANETITRTHEGSGLGLAISKAYVEMLGGKIWVESALGKGSTFYFTIPFNAEYELEEKKETQKMPSEIKEENKIKDLKILIVEDDAISKLLITIAVKPYSKEILKVSTGLEAIEVCRTHPDIDLVMMDINMPEMGGYDATKQIREFNKDLIIIAQTANGMQSDRDDAIAAGCTDYMSKPVNIKSLGALIQKYFKE